MYNVFDEKGVLIMTTDNEEEADTFAWLYNGYYTFEK